MERPKEKTLVRELENGFEMQTRDDEDDTTTKSMEKGEKGTEGGRNILSSRRIQTT